MVQSVPADFQLRPAGMVPPYATAAVLVLVGVFMFSGVAGLDFTRIEDALPAFLTIILIPLTFSITQGILWGFITHAGLYTLAGRGREVGAVMYALVLVSVGLLLLERFA